MPDQVVDGQAVYTRRTLAVYNLVVLGISNRFVWKCPMPRLLAHCERHVSANHLDVGVGTGYFLGRFRFPALAPRIVLTDLNPNALAFACHRIARCRPSRYRRNVLDPVSIGGNGFDSGLVLGGESLYTQLLSRGGTPFVKVVSKDGREQVLTR
jgi:hypothetical protein